MSSPIRNLTLADLVDLEPEQLNQVFKALGANSTKLIFKTDDDSRVVAVEADQNGGAK